jgi:hypothetical protein
MTATTDMTPGGPRLKLKDKINLFKSLTKGSPNPDIKLAWELICTLDEKTKQLQAKVDFLMLTHCPDKMTNKQKRKWEKPELFVTEAMELESLKKDKLDELITKILM